MLRALLAGERVSYRGRFIQLDGVQISPLPRVAGRDLDRRHGRSSGRACRNDRRWLVVGPEQFRRRGRSHSSTFIARPPRSRDGRCGRCCVATSSLPTTDAAAHAEVDKVLAEGYRGTGKAELLVGSAAAVVDRLGAVSRARVRRSDGATHHRRSRVDATLVRTDRRARDAGDPSAVVKFGESRPCVFTEMP